MSFEVDDICEVYQTHWHVARKPHRCQCCCYMIPVGAQYQRHSMVQDGSASDEACCFACAFGLWQLLRRNGSAPSPSWAIEFLTDEIDQHGRAPREERDILAGMIRRSRAASRG